MLGHVYMTVFLVLAATRNARYIIMYGLGVALAFIAGHICLWFLRSKGEENMLRDYQGAVYVSTGLSHFFFIVALLFMAFPISPSFLAQDILLSLIPENHVFQFVLFCFAYLLVGVSIMRLYVKLFFGPHRANYHEKAFRSS